MFLKNKVINYELVSMTGHAHTPVFTFRINSDKLCALGSGSSKKEAKRNAVIAFLDKIACSNDIKTITSTTSNVSPTQSIDHSENGVKKITEAKLEINPVGLLQEICMARHWELPNYEYLIDVQNCGFIVRCCLRNFITTGEGKTKQSAKKKAALNMYNHFKYSVHNKIIAPYYEEYQTPIKAMLNNKLPIDENGTKQLEKINPSDVLQSMESFMNTLKASNKSSLNSLKTLDLMKQSNIFCAVDTLDKIAKEEGFESKYVLVSNNSQLGILVQVSITSLLVNIAFGNTVEEAKEKAAFYIIMYFKILREI